LQTAYFVIPSNVKHGEELICSYFACRNAGIKFRYCSHCKVPVAKRNFRKRHKHGGEDFPKGAGEEAADTGDEADAAMKKGIPSQITASREVVNDADDISSQSADSTKEQEKKMTEADVQQGLVRNSMRTFESKKSKFASAAKGAGVLPAGDGTITDKRQKQWAVLLGKRPSTKDGNSMSAWLMEVLAVSDLGSPLKAGEDLSAIISQVTNLSAKKSRGADSPTSDNGYKSSNDETSGNDKKKDSSRNTSDAFNGGIIKKKRPAEGEAPSGGSAEPYASGSFAEWKERKKQKKAMKDSGSGPTSPTAAGPAPKDA